MRTLFILATLGGTLAAALLLAADAPACDLLLRNGTVVDGTGNPWFLGDVAITGDRIVAIGRNLPGTAKRTLDAKGLVIAPGFIDIHSHSDDLLLEDSHAQSKIRQGVTTEVLGEGQGQVLPTIFSHARRETALEDSIIWAAVERNVVSSGSSWV